MFKEIFLAGAGFFTAAVTAFISSNHPRLAFTLAVIAAVFFVVLFFFSIKKASTVNVDLNLHPFWSRMNYYIKQKLPYTNIPDPLRKKLFVTTMTTKFEIATEQARIFILAEKFDACKAKDLVTNIVQMYESKWRSENVPEIFVEQFHMYNKPKIQSLIEYIEFICVSRFYDSDIDKKVAILDGMLHVFQWTIIDLERSDAAINGTLTSELKVLWSQGKF